MSSLNQILYILLGAAPYLLVLVYLLIFKKTKQFSISAVFLGLLGIVVAVAAGGFAGVLVILNYPQTGSSLNNGFLIGVLALTVGVAMVVGEAIRYAVVSKYLKEDEQKRLVGLAYGVGFSFGEFLIYLVPVILNWGSYATLDSSIIIAVDVGIQLMISIAAYELIKQQNFASFAVGALYYVSFFLTYILHNSVVLNIGAKAIVFIIAAALLYAFIPKKSERLGETL